MPTCLRPSIFSIVFASLATLSLAGCSASFTPSAVTPNRVPIGNIQGKAHGGQAPAVGAQIYLFAAGTGGYETSATSLITSGAPGTKTPGNLGTRPKGQAMVEIEEL